MSILGHDIDGQPLRVGDRVVILKAVDPIYSDYIGRTIVVIGAAKSCGEVYLDVESRRGGRVKASYDCIRKLPPKQADNETTTWESIKELTGWTPERVEA